MKMKYLGSIHKLINDSAHGPVISVFVFAKYEKSGVKKWKTKVLLIMQINTYYINITSESHRRMA